MFKPDRVIYPAAGKHEILVAGEVDGEARNVTITNEDLAAEYRSCEEEHRTAVAALDKTRQERRAALDEKAMGLAEEKFAADNKPPVEE